MSTYKNLLPELENEGVRRWNLAKMFLREYKSQQEKIVEQMMLQLPDHVKKSYLDHEIRANGKLNICKIYNRMMAAKESGQLGEASEIQQKLHLALSRYMQIETEIDPIMNASKPEKNTMGLVQAVMNKPENLELHHEAGRWWSKFKTTVETPFETEQTQQVRVVRRTTAPPSPAKSFTAFLMGARAAIHRNRAVQQETAETAEASNDNTTKCK